jgi:hypothetical protein
MMGIQLEIAKAEAEVKKLQSEAAVNIAKVQDVAEVDPQMRMAELQAKIDMNQQQLDLRRELSSATNQQRADQMQTSAATKLATTALQASKTTPKPPQAEARNTL